MPFEALTHMACGEAAPHDVGKLRRDVIERLSPNQRFVRGREKRQAGPEARPQNPYAVVAL
jgi:hypothetical protein